MPESPGFHHLHLNSTDPEPAIDFYTKRFPTTSRTTWGGQPALMSPNNVLVLFEKVAVPPLTYPEAPATAFWHFGWHVLDTSATRDRFKADGVPFLPLYTGDSGGTVLISSDTWPGANGLLGRTVEQIAEAKATGVQPTHVAGFGYIEGPDHAMVEYAGNQPQERFNHVHMWQENPFCAQLWYQTHLHAPLMAGRSVEGVTLDTCVVERTLELTYPALEPEGMYRAPSAAVEFGDVAMMWYMRQGSEPLAPTRGQLYDHVALSVTDLDGWLSKLRGEGVGILEEPYKLGDTRAFMIEGPSLEAIELVQV
jgi:catechol 2,3-dioxygenase-like lactoylglutathione lyase family enzyme